MQDLLNKIPSKFHNYQIDKINSGASKRYFYRISNNSNSFICMDSQHEEQEYENYLKIHSYLSKINISIPKIYEKYDDQKILILEDFGNLRFDKILSRYPTKHLLSSAVDTLIVLNNQTGINKNLNLSIYNFETLKLEISEFLDYYYPYFYQKKVSKSIREDFISKWKNFFDSEKF